MRGAAENQATPDNTADMPLAVDNVIVIFRLRAGERQLQAHFPRARRARRDRRVGDKMRSIRASIIPTLTALAILTAVPPTRAQVEILYSWCAYYTGGGLGGGASGINCGLVKYEEVSVATPFFGPDGLTLYAGQNPDLVVATPFGPPNVVLAGESNAFAYRAPEVSADCRTLYFWRIDRSSGSLIYSLKMTQR